MSTTKLTGRAAIDHAERHGLTLSKYADPIEDERDDLAVEEARAIALEDPNLIWLDVEAEKSSSGTSTIAIEHKGEETGGLWQMVHGADMPYAPACWRTQQAAEEALPGIMERGGDWSHGGYRIVETKERLGEDHHTVNYDVERVLRTYPWRP